MTAADPGESFWCRWRSKPAVDAENPRVLTPMEVEVLFHWLGAWLFRIARRRIYSDGDVAEDLVAESLLAAWQWLKRHWGALETGSKAQWDENHRAQRLAPGAATPGRAVGGRLRLRNSTQKRA